MYAIGLHQGLRHSAATRLRFGLSAYPCASNALIVFARVCELPMNTIRYDGKLAEGVTVK